MVYKEKGIRCKKLDEWLGGMFLEEKIKNLEQGQLMQCMQCGYMVYDLEPPEDYIRKKCKIGDKKHVFAPVFKYIILKRNFKGIVDVVAAHFSEKPEDAIVRYFQTKRD